ncbi:MAG: hypothetical protein QXN01_03165 [Candidatus Anstonellales archaeon]
MKKEVVVGILIIVVVILILIKPWEAAVSAEDATKYVMEDMRTKYPNADIIEVLSTREEYGSYKIKGRVSFEITSKCPQRLHLYYDYPASHFVTWTENITKNCKVCEGLPKCIVAFEEEAVAASHTYSGGERARKYLEDYPDAKASWRFLDEFEGKEEVWLVIWKSPKANSILKVYISKPENRILKVEEEQG